MSEGRKRRKTCVPPVVQPPPPALAIVRIVGLGDGIRTGSRECVVMNSKKEVVGRLPASSLLSPSFVLPVSVRGATNVVLMEGTQCPVPIRSLLSLPDSVLSTQLTMLGVVAEGEEKQRSLKAKLPATRSKRGVLIAVLVRETESRRRLSMETSSKFTTETSSSSGYRN